MAGLFKNIHAVNPVGLIVMALGVAAVALAGSIAARLLENRREAGKTTIKLIGLGICMAGFLIALL